jgi:hypothetical protein
MREVATPSAGGSHGSGSASPSKRQRVEPSPVGGGDMFSLGDGLDFTTKTRNSKVPNSYLYLG